MKKIIFGIDVGAATAALVLRDTDKRLIAKQIILHYGDMKNVVNIIRGCYLSDHDISKTVITGSLAKALSASLSKNNVQMPHEVIPECMAQGALVNAFYPEIPSLNLVQIGASHFSILTKKNGRFRYAQNDVCSAGTGTAIERTCAGYNYQLEDLDSLKNVKPSIIIANRCSVIAKSDMIHHGNSGVDSEELLAAYFHSIAANISAFITKERVPGKIMLIGGVTKNECIVNRIQEILGGKIEIAPNNAYFEAEGALCFAEQLLSSPDYYLNVFTGEKQQTENEIKTLPPLSSFLNRVTKHESTDNILDENVENIALGFDIGSTGTKIALVNAQNKQLLYSDYCSTKAEGGPIMAVKKLIAKIPDEYFAKVMIISLTGSGRLAVAEAMQAIFPAKQIFVETEILAHAFFASRFSSGKKKYQIVIEIGGQDAKCTIIKNGCPVDYVMNQACSAGTGSFLQEVGLQYGEKDIVKLGQRALEAKNPPDLGQHCPVFIGDTINKAIKEGSTLSDVFGGLYYAIVYNYLNRVVGKRRLRGEIVIQGMPANNSGLGAGFNAITGKDIIVPPNPGMTGAFGIALLALKEFSQKLSCFEKLDIRNFLDVKVLKKDSFQCKDSKCGNLCRINQTVFQVGNETKRVQSGGNCPKYEQIKTHKLPQGAPNALRYRQELIDSLLKEYDESKKTIGIPSSLANVRFMPLFITFFQELGFNVRILNSDSESMEKGRRFCNAPDACAPVVLFHSLFDEYVDFFFAPKIVSLPMFGRSVTCTLAQGAPDMVYCSLHDNRILMPILYFSDAFESAKPVFADLAEKTLRISKEQADKAFDKAVHSQNQIRCQLKDYGEKIIDYAQEHSLPVILLLGRLYLIYDRIISSGIPEEIQRNGALLLPIDFFPIQKTPLESLYWGEGKSNLGAMASLLEFLKGKDINIFPLWLSCFNCGPDSFLSDHFFSHISADYPHLILETDGHSGSGGFVTRIQAFLSIARSYMASRQKKETDEEKRSDITPFLGINSIKVRKDVKLLIPPMGIGNQFIAAVFCSIGADVEALSLIDKETFELGRQSCTGKECIPMMAVWGSIKKYLLENNHKPGSKIVFFLPTANGPCRYGSYRVFVDLLVKQMNLNVEVGFFSPTTSDNYDFGFTQVEKLKLWAAICIQDLLRQLLYFVRPIEQNKGDSERIFEKWKKLFIEYLEKPNALWALLRVLPSMMKKAANDFKNIAVNPDKDKNVVNISLDGEIYVRNEDHTNNFLIKKLEACGLRVFLAPISEWIDYISFCSGCSKKEKFFRWLMKHRLSEKCANAFPGWPAEHSIEEIVKMGSKRLSENIPDGEAVLSIGSPLLRYSLGETKGAVIVGPRGCMPTKIAEAQHKGTNLPVLYIYVDGDRPIDEDVIASFAWQLHSSN